ncbi:MAG: murein biosynthesis integral membrane protein MurJ [Puniceicoccales bacterium]|jgi:putative peptidoglycan lipid II flippase|nr:murein biosynthesis integral membrane protein MurJ [Puniceicoccales bacterium]
MAKNRSSTLKNIAIVSGATVVSRILGYLRDILMITFLGISEISDAFLLALCLPNVFRKLLGEGAVSSTIVPVLSSHNAKYGKNSMLQLFSSILLRLFLCLAGILLLLYGAIFFANAMVHGAKWRMVLSFTAMMLPHMAFVCLAVMITAVLQVVGKFFVASIGQILVNISMIASLLLGHFLLKYGGIKLAHCLIIGLLVGGALQLAVPAFAVISMGWPWKFDAKVPHLKARMGEIWKLFVPGVFGAVVEQADIIIFRMIAFSSASAVSFLYVANRLIELPIGVFGFSIASVFFPNMAKFASSSADDSRMGDIFRACFAAVLWILVPSAIGLFILNGEIVSVFFEYGNFRGVDVLSVCPIISVYCINMLFSGISPVFVRGFHALGDTKTPAAIGVVTLGTNALLSLALVKSFGAIGVASAITCAAAVQTLCLAAVFSGKMNGAPTFLRAKDCGIIFGGGVTVAIVALGIKFFIPLWCHLGKRVSDILTIVLAVGMSACAHLLISRKFIGRTFSPQQK